MFIWWPLSHCIFDFPATRPSTSPSLPSLYSLADVPSTPPPLSPEVPSPLPLQPSQPSLLGTGCTIITLLGGEAYTSPQPPNLGPVTAIAAGYGFTLALLTKGTVVCWVTQDIAERYGETDMHYGACNIPSGLVNVVAIAAGWLHGMAITDNGTVVVWGSYVSFDAHPYPLLGAAYVPIFPQRIVAVDGGIGHSIALTDTGKVVSWGPSVEYGQMNMPVGIGIGGSAQPVTAISAMGINNAALLQDGSFVVWGDTYNGAIISMPYILSITPMKMVAAGCFHFVALTVDGVVYAWGSNDYGESTPPAGLQGAMSVDAGDGYSSALLTNGSAVVWGSSFTYGVMIPDAVSNIIALAAGSEQLVLLSSCISPMLPPTSPALSPPHAPSTPSSLPPHPSPPPPPTQPAEHVPSSPSGEMSLGDIESQIMIEVQCAHA